MQRKIYMDAKNEVDIKDGTVNADLPVPYDMKGNPTSVSGVLGVGAGGFRTQYR